MFLTPLMVEAHGMCIIISYSRLYSNCSMSHCGYNPLNFVNTNLVIILIVTMGTVTLSC